VGQQDSNRNSRQNIHGDEWDEVRSDVSEMAGVAVERGRHFIDAARDQASDYADRRKDDIAQSVADFASSLRESTSSFEERPNIRAVVDSAAEGLETLADTIRERNFADMFNDFENMVRRRPATVAAVSVAVGFLTARFIKSTAEELRHEPIVSSPARSRSRRAQGPQAATGA
jgi:ElaB/YqjD/DUF883 family membrane-anchored ribosome-binding protein